MLLLIAIFTATSFLFVALAVPLIRRRVRPNALYGLRVPATFADEWVWYEANARSGWDLLRLGLAGLFAALALPVVPGITLSAYSIANGAILGGGAVVLGIFGCVRANRLLKERRGGKNPA
jgi:uncharacterized membrane protein